MTRVSVDVLVGTRIKVLSCEWNIICFLFFYLCAVYHFVELVAGLTRCTAMSYTFLTASFWLFRDAVCLLCMALVLKTAGSVFFLNVGRYRFNRVAWEHARALMFAVMQVLSSSVR